MFGALIAQDLKPNIANSVIFCSDTEKNIWKQFFFLDPIFELEQIKSKIQQ